MLTSVEDELERMNVGNRMRLCLCESVLKLKGTKQVEEFFETRNGRAKESPVLAETLKEGVGSGSREGESAQRKMCIRDRAVEEHGRYAVYCVVDL